MTDILAPAPAAPVLNLPPIAPAPAAPPEPGLGAEIKTDWSYHRDAHKAKTRAERRAALRKAREAVERRAETKRERLAKEERGTRLWQRARSRPRYQGSGDKGACGSRPASHGKGF
jgi:hypothetical protein